MAESQTLGSTHLGDQSPEVSPVLVVATHEPNEHTGFEATKCHLAHMVKTESLELRSTVRLTIMQLHRIEWRAAAARTHQQPLHQRETLALRQCAPLAIAVARRPPRCS